MSDIYTLEDALDMMRSLGELTGKTEKANAIASEVERQFTQHLSLLPAIADAKAGTTYHSKVAYLIWRKPFMAGFKNVFANLSRYPEISSEQLAIMRPEVILLSSEPYPFSEKHIVELQEICPESRIQLVDGELFSWYGSRLLSSPAYFAGLLDGSEPHSFIEPQKAQKDT